MLSRWMKVGSNVNVNTRGMVLTALQADGLAAHSMLRWKEDYYILQRDVGTKQSFVFHIV